MPKRSILITKRTFSLFGGLEKNALRLAKALTDKGFDVHFLSSSKLESMPYRCIYQPLSKRLSRRGKVHMFDRLSQKWQKENSYHTVIGMDRTTMQTHLRAGDGCHKSYLQRRKQAASFFEKLFLPFNPMHSTLLQLEKKAFENPHLQKLIVNSNMVKEEILSHYSISEQKITVIHNGVEWQENQPLFDQAFENQRELQKKLSLKPDHRVFLFVGNGYKRKGLVFLLQALAQIAKSPFYLLVIGKDKNIAYYQKLAKKMHLENKVLFLGPQRNVYPYYQLADALIIPSIYDPFANITLEALSMGLYVLSSTYNGGKEILTTTTGQTVDIFDIKGFSEKLLYLMEKKKTPTSALQIRSAIKDFDFSKQMHTLVSSVAYE
jgi:UDP-glucose:(heptosyl)LPS alpha-1,3-glucosyltransferase